LDISTRLDIVPEAVPQDKKAQERAMQKKINKTKSLFKKQQIKRDYEELREAQARMEELQ